MPGTTRKESATPKQSPRKAPAKAATKPTYGLGLTNKSFELELPSGSVCLANRPGAQGLIKAGLLDSMDQLTALVQTEHIDSNDPRQMSEAVKVLSSDLGKMAEGLEMVDRCIAFVVQEPKVWLDERILGADGEPRSGTDGKPLYYERSEDRIYADMVDLEDKMFIFNWALGGTADLKSFREESSKLLGGISAS